MKWIELKVKLDLLFVIKKFLNQVFIGFKSVKR